MCVDQMESLSYHVTQIISFVVILGECAGGCQRERHSRYFFVRQNQQAEVLPEEEETLKSG
jgi:hypothetical protein